MRDAEGRSATRGGGRGFCAAWAARGRSEAEPGAARPGAKRRGTPSKRLSDNSADGGATTPIVASERMGVVRATGIARAVADGIGACVATGAAIGAVLACGHLMRGHAVTESAGCRRGKAQRRRGPCGALRKQGRGQARQARHCPRLFSAESASAPAVPVHHFRAVSATGNGHAGRPAPTPACWPISSASTCVAGSGSTPNSRCKLRSSAR